MKSVLLIDAHALIHRAFHALPPLSGPHGEPTGALYGLARILMKVLRDRKFTRIFAAFDRPEPTFRKDTFAAYKAHRPKAPDELVAQLVEARELFRTFNIPVMEVPKVEADDIIGTLATRLARESYEVTILTGDLDALQLVKDPHVKVETFKKGVSETFVYDEAAVRERYGFGPEYVPDLKGIMGDASDNIKGVPGVGEGSALKLIRALGGLDDIYRALAKDGAEGIAARAGIHTRFAKLMDTHEKEARFSQKLATIDTDVSLRVPDEDWREAPQEAIATYFSRMGFDSLLKGVPAAPRREVKPEDRLAAPKGVFPKGAVFIANAHEARERMEKLVGSNEKIAYGWKEILKGLGDNAAKIAPPLFDLSVAGWLVDPDQSDCSREALFARFLPKGASSDVALYRFLKEKLETYGLSWVYERIEMPLIPVLAKMERAGIAVSRVGLEQLAHTMRKELQDLEIRIYREAGGAFNLNSPRQVAEVLFERLGLGTEKRKKTRTGQRRTGHDVLTELKGVHPAVPLLLEYRETFKIHSSFVTPLLEAIGDDGRVHTTFNETGTATGRLSSEHPNLQNIPQESRWAPPLRSAFVAPPRTLLVSFDYSQLELRLLAHTCHDRALTEAFMRGEDIHRLTAAKVFAIAPDKVTPRMRRTAKTLNFGIVYGMGGRAFAASAGLTLAEAKRFIEEYFRQFPSVQKWQERVKEEAKANGYVINENGRRRWFLSPTNRTYKWGEVERAAINMPLQSLGADIIKRAMVETDAFVHEKSGGKARIVLSIHDELLFEMPRGMLSTLAPIIKERMETIAALSVPLHVDIHTGTDWGTMEAM